MKHNILRVGDVVKLESGGPDMLVWAMDSGGNAHCKWPDEHGPQGEQRETYCPSKLVMVKQHVEPTPEGEADAVTIVEPVGERVAAHSDDPSQDSVGNAG